MIAIQSKSYLKGVYSKATNLQPMRNKVRLGVYNARSPSLRKDVFIYGYHSWVIHCTKVFVFGVFLVLIFPQSNWMRIRKTLNTDTFYAVSLPFSSIQTHFPLLELNFFVGFTARQPTQLAFTCLKPLIKTEAKDIKPA